MALYIKGVVTLGHYTDLPADAVMNTFALQPGTLFSPESQYDDICDALAGFYNVATASTNRIATYLSDSLSRGVDRCLVQLYNVTGHLDGSPHGSPVYEKPFQLGNSDGGDNLPEEVACALTLRGSGWGTQSIEVADGADPGSAPDRPRQRYTGRVYIGPFTATVLHTDASQRSRPSAALRNQLLESAEWLIDELFALANEWQWCVWSRANEDFIGISDVQVDDAWDTMRSRGPAPTLRDSRYILP